MGWYGYAPYVPVAKRRAEAARKIEKLKKKGQKISPVVLEGKTITKSFWGKSWCQNLESYSDYENRLPRGRTYVRSGYVCDLQVRRGEVTAMVVGSSMYDVRVTIAPVVKNRWASICEDVSGSVGTLVELLQGKLSKNVMERVCRKEDGLFPSPREIKLSCSCPDGARMCKHVAAAMYGIGARLDEKPDLLFMLRAVDEKELIAKAGTNLSLTDAAQPSERVIANDDLSALFGIEMEVGEVVPISSTLVSPPPTVRCGAGKAKKKAVAKKRSVNKASSVTQTARKAPAQKTKTETRHPAAPAAQRKGTKAKKKPAK
jgi:uncharacterized Zn finger protein